MQIEFNTLYWNNITQLQIDSHKSVFDHFSVSLRYTAMNIDHGLWMDQICAKSDSDVIVFFDIDCVPINFKNILKLCEYAKSHNTFVGIAQASNHINNGLHIFAAPAFFAISKSSWKYLNTSFTGTSRGDVAEELTYKAEELGLRHRCIYPSYYEHDSRNGKWNLGNYGYFGIGTVYEDYCYHLYEGRTSLYQEKFAERCRQIIENRFTTKDFIKSTIL